MDKDRPSFFSFAKDIVIALGIVAALTLWSEAARATTGEKWYATDGKDTVWLSDEPCVNAEVLRHAPPQARDKMYRGRGTINGKPWEMCWVPVGDKVIMLFPDGEGGMVPVYMLQTVTKS